MSIRDKDEFAKRMDAIVEQAFDLIEEVLREIATERGWDVSGPDALVFDGETFEIGEIVTDAYVECTWPLELWEVEKRIREQFDKLEGDDSSDATDSN